MPQPVPGAIHRAYSTFEIKAVDEDEDEDKRVISGIATTPMPDRVGDVVEPKGAQFSLPIPLLWQHNSREPIGHVTAAKVTKDGITITAKLVKIDEPGKLKERLDAVGDQSGALLELLDGGFCLGAVPAIGGNLESGIDEQALQLGDFRADDFAMHDGLRIGD